MQNTAPAERRTPRRRSRARSIKLLTSLMKSDGGREPAEVGCASSDKGEFFVFCFLAKAALQVEVWEPEIM